MRATGRPQPPGLTADGFLPTGDLVRLNPEGTITILGREKQIIIRGGRNIDVNEVEAAVARIPSVAQVCVVPLPDEMLGERVAALVVSAGAAARAWPTSPTISRPRASPRRSGRSSSSTSPTSRRTGSGSCPDRTPSGSRRSSTE